MNIQIYEEASNWFVDFRAGDMDADARRRFNAWIRKSPEHLRAYLEIAELWQDASEVDLTQASDPAELIKLAQAESNTVSLNSAARIETPPPTTVRGGRDRRGWETITRYAIAASLLLFVVGAVTFTALSDRLGATTYSTGIGEQRLISLADGSTISLNTQSQIAVLYSRSERTIELVRGQALFRVAKDKSRPFTVRNGEALVRAVGTQFDVYQKSIGTAVTVLEGTVAVANGDIPSDVVNAYADTRGVRSDGSVSNEMESGRLALVTAGHQVVVSLNMPLRPQAADTDSATAWTKQQVVFKSATLEEVAREINRYNRRQIVIEDKDLAELQISGVYSPTNPALLLQFLNQQPDIHVVETETAAQIKRGE